MSAPAPPRFQTRPEALIEQILERHPEADVTLLQKAYLYAARMHGGQLRRSGEPFLIHPLEVARIVADLHLDDVTIAAALLHDVIEDCDVTLEDLRREFGREIAQIVAGLTRIKEISFTSPQEEQAENFRKMLVAMAEDIRVLIIKLADRLHNMRTLEYLPRERQIEIARETRDIYAPLANRLGIGRMKNEFEDLCFRYLEPEAYAELARQIPASRKEIDAYIERIKRIVRGDLERAGIPAILQGRLKHMASIHAKMVRRGIPLSQVYDLIALRVITDTPGNCYVVLGLLHARWKPVPQRVRDWIAAPKSNMYQSLHTTVIGPEGRHVEFQIRTHEMHRIAEEGIAAHWKYKEGDKASKSTEAQFMWLRQLLEWQQDVTNNREFMRSVRTDLFEDEVYVFTPKGEVKELPRGATPVDFAYAVHTEVGHHCVGAKVDGRLVPLRQPLSNGVTVEILTSPTQHPRKEWLTFVVSSKARNRIRHYLNQVHKRRAEEIGTELLEKEARRHHLSLTRLKRHPHLKEQLAALGHTNLKSFITAVGAGRQRPEELVRPLVGEGVPKPTLLERVGARLPRRPNRDGVRVRGSDDILVRFARCCSPVHGDPIAGYVTQGQGVSIHHRDCKNFQALAADEQRVVEVEWDRNDPTERPVPLVLYTSDHRGLLARISGAISEMGANIREAKIATSEDGRGRMDFTIDVRDAQQLERIVQRLRQIPDVVSVERQGSPT
ncbi:MAG: bifunctional (p)ppGpp synthetase/guanosine-3',5'-bis(diphosphate) 3'-pyrophosphohydrolase, partial [Nitrospirae bacterium]